MYWRHLSPRQVRDEAGVNNIVEPVSHGGVKLMFLEYVLSGNGVPGSGASDDPAVLRGPMARTVVSQLLRGTNWGELDVLVLDLPLGTGDVQLEVEVCQTLLLSGMVAVSTPRARSPLRTWSRGVFQRRGYQRVISGGELRARDPRTGDVADSGCDRGDRGE